MFVFERIYLLLCLCLSKTILAIFNGFGVYGFIPYKGVTPLPPVSGQQIAEKKYLTYHCICQTRIIDDINRPLNQTMSCIGFPLKM